ncbi:MAG: magnesium chelatase, partial [Anaerolineae bacterium]|nr:magnesium chelatase [Anaerolineae bacterium]
DIYLHPDLERYIVDIVSATRRSHQVLVGASPRGSLALLTLARVRAALAGRDYVLPDDVKAFAQPALVHRLILEPGLWLKQRAADEIIDAIVAGVAVPVIEEG